MTHYHSLLKGLALVSGLALIMSTGHVLANSDEVHWDYEGEHGPEHWGELDERFSSCEEGMNQSPFDLVGILDADLPILVFDYPNTGHLVEKNTGHAIQEDARPGNHVHLQNQSYELKQFHFHSPSEQTVNGGHYPMEVHFVHQNEHGELLVVGLIFEEGQRPIEVSADQIQHYRDLLGFTNNRPIQPINARVVLE